MRSKEGRKNTKTKDEKVYRLPEVRDLDVGLERRPSGLTFVVTGRNPLRRQISY
jgi:hypothetical protein